MKSVSGKYWEEEKINNRLIEKIKIDHSFKRLIANQILLNKFDDNEIYSIKNSLEILNPFIKKSDFINAVNLLDKAIKNNENICIIGDYDVDGCISTSLLVRFLKNINANYFFYIPNRFTDGYGSSLDLVKKIIKKKPDLIIMVDNGSSSNDTIDYLNNKNIKSIIIDHHEIYKPYPKSNILINPKKDSNYSEFNYFCTGVLTYFFIDLYIKIKKLKIDFSKNLNLVLLTIVSDIMPLRKINRLIAIKVLNNTHYLQDYFFKKVFDIKKINKPIDIDDFGFLFGPIINSAGRLDDPNIIVDLFTIDNKDLKDKLINKLLLLNEKRKFIEEKILDTIDFKKINFEDSPILIYENYNINEGIIGIIASKIKTYFDKPAVVITKSGDKYKGSARSTNNFPIGKCIKIALDKKLLDSGGGHNLAAGFIIKKKNIENFKSFLNNFSKNKISPTIYKYVSKISLNSLNRDFLLDLNKLQPFGEKNINPYFLLENVRIIKSKKIKNKFVTCFVKNKSGKMIQALTFSFMNSDLCNNILYNKNELNMIIQVKEKFWNNKKSLQLIIIDIFHNSNKA